MQPSTSHGSGGDSTPPSESNESGWRIVAAHVPNLRNVLPVAWRSQAVGQSLRQGVGLIKALAFLISSPRNGKRRSSASVRRQRLNTCSTCEMYDSNFGGTCGTPGTFYEDPATGQKEKLGCWCLCNLLASLSKSECWLDYTMGEDAPHGWVASERRKTSIQNLGDTKEA